MSTHVDPVPYEARPFQGRRAGLATRAAAAVIDVAIVLIALGVGYLGICAYVGDCCRRLAVYPLSDRELDG